MKPNYRIGLLMLCTGFLGSALALANSSGEQKQSSTHRYSVQGTPGMTMITDHQTNKLYCYKNTDEGCELVSTTDLNQTGKQIMKAEVKGKE
jgi:hypothetical protein